MGSRDPEIVPSLEEGLKLVREYSLPLEIARMKTLGYPGSAVGKILVFERETNPSRKVTLVFVNEKNWASSGLGQLTTFLNRYRVAPMVTIPMSPITP